MDMSGTWYLTHTVTHEKTEAIDFRFPVLLFKKWISWNHPVISYSF